MIIVLIILAHMVISTILVVAAGMLSSRLSSQEGRIETYPEQDSAETDMAPQTID